MALDRTLGHRAPLLWLALPFMGGLAAGRAGAAAPIAIELAAALAAAALAAWVAGRHRIFWSVSVSAAMLLAGNASCSLNGKRPSDWDGMPEREARLALRLDRVAPGSEATRQATGVGTVVEAAGRLRELMGQRIYFSLRLRRGERPPVSSATVSAIGLLGVVPRHASPQSFDGYLSGLGVNFWLSRGRILARRKPPAAYRLWCEKLAGKMNDLLGAGIGRHPALAAVYRAMMLGRRRELSEEQNQLFLHGGAMHLFAINGLHIGVVALSLHALLTLVRCPRLLGGALVLAVLWLDVDTTGASPSAVRAFFMVAAVEAAGVLRRPGNPLAALTASALLVLLADPMDFFSASFEMSYAVVAAIFALGLPLGARLLAHFPPNPGLPKITWRWRHHGRAAAARHLLPAMGVGAAATLISAAAAVEFFGLLAPVGMAADLILAPLASLVIVAGFASLVAGLSGAIAGTRLFNAAAAVVLQVIDFILRRVTAMPGAWLPAHYRADWIGPATLALLVASCLAGYAGGWRRERGGFWPPFAIATLAIALGVSFHPH
jgi:competence protein ComEC